MRHARRTARRNPRRNPRAPTTPKHPTLVLVRRFDPTAEGPAPWEVLLRDADGSPAVFSPKGAKVAALRKPSTGANAVAHGGDDLDLHVGDLIATVPLEYASPLTIGEHATGLYVVTPDGVEAAPKHDEFTERGGSWLSVWGQDAERMLSLSINVDRKRLAMAACECAETVLPVVYPGEERPRRAIEAAVAWCRGAATIAQVLEAIGGANAFAGEEAYAASKANAYATNAKVWGAAAAARAAAFAACVVLYDNPVSPVVSAANALKEVFGTPRETTYQRLAPIVEKWVPLPVAILSALGYRDPIPFDPGTVPTGPRENPRPSSRRRSHR